VIGDEFLKVFVVLLDDVAALLLGANVMEDRKTRLAGCLLMTVEHTRDIVHLSSWQTISQ